VPSFENVRSRYLPSDIEVLDRDGRFLQRVRTERSYRASRWHSLNEFSENLVNAIVHSEDKRFFSHPGVDPLALLHAVMGYLQGHPRGGASTISMQTISLIDPGLKRRSKRRSYGQKIAQMLGALVLEASWTKEQILETYLNLVPLRGELRGVPIAATSLLQAHPRFLSPEQSMVLASLIPSPNSSLRAVETRACQRLGKDPSVCALARFPQDDTSTRATLLGISGSSLTAPAARNVLTLYQQEHTRKDAFDRVHTSIDGALQDVAFNALAAHLSPLRARHASDGAVLVVHNQSGEVRAYVPNSGASASKRFVDGVLARRQAGSTLKPFLYARAFERNLITPSSLLLDEPFEIAVFGGAYRPENYDHTFRGSVSAADALGSSLNIPALRVLGLLGLAEGGSTLAALHLLAPSSINRYGYSIALGAPSVRLWDLVNAYRTLANQGRFSALTLSPAKTLVSRDGQVVFSPDSAQIVSEVLSLREHRHFTFGLENTLATPFWSAVKTGTSKDMTDNWCIGFTPEYTVGVWIGNFDGSPMRNVSGVSGAAPLWGSLMRWLHVNRPAPVDQDAPRHRFETLPVIPVTTRDRQAQIVYPTEGASFAVDPGMPSEHQAIIFRSRSATSDMQWRLNGKILGPATAPVPWQPVKGTYTLELVERSRDVPSRVSFVVR
jgi:penicillin-binding protein 1C